MTRVPPVAIEPAEASAALAGTRWRVEGEQLAIDVELPSFAEALGAVVSVGALAEAADHHPRVVLDYRRLHLELTTHEIGSLSVRDLELARAISGLPGFGT